MARGRLDIATPAQTICKTPLPALAGNFALSIADADVSLPSLRYGWYRYNFKHPSVRLTTSVAMNSRKSQRLHLSVSTTSPPLHLSAISTNPKANLIKNIPNILSQRTCFSGSKTRLWRRAMSQARHSTWREWSSIAIEL